MAWFIYLFIRIDLIKNRENISQYLRIRILRKNRFKHYSNDLGKENYAN